MEFKSHETENKNKARIDALRYHLLINIKEHFKPP